MTTGAGGNVITGGTHGTVVQAGHIEHLVVRQAPPPADEVTVAPPFGRRGAPLRGRDALLALLLGASGTHVLYGLGGVGKTSLALEVAGSFAAQGAPVWWVAAQDGGRLAGGMRAVARRLGLGEEELASGQTADLLWERLARLPGRWLLVLDNADDLGLLDGPGSLAAGTGWVRTAPGSGGLVLVTTRDGDLGAWGAGPVLHPLGVLPGDQGGRVLVDRATTGAGPSADAELLAVRLGGLPLALDSAGRYLASVVERPAFLRAPGEPATYAAYLAALGAGDVTVDGDGTLARIWAMSLRLLRDRGHGHAETLLRLLAGFADAPVPLRVFAAGRVDIPPGELWSCLQALDRLGLAALGTDGEPVVSLHPLVRDAYRGERERLSARLVGELGDPEDRDPLWPLLVPHLLDDLGRDVPERAWKAAVSAVHVLDVLGLVREAAAAGRAVRDRAVAALTEHHPLARMARMGHARGLLVEGRVEEALPLLEALTRECVRAEGADDALTLMVRNEYANALQMAQDYERAAVENAEVLALRVGLFGEAHAMTLATRHNLAVTLSMLGRYEEALAELDAVHTAELGLYGPDDPRVLVTRENRACIRRDLGDPEAARPELEAVLAARVRVLDADHPQTLAARFNLATCLDPAAAVPELTAVLDARTRVLGPGHPVTAATRATLEHMARTLPR
ncbi:tetratricopeptide repeat protein [Streptomyces sp. NPDC020422]|uniref:tetratricopeptide repeat protein n=1 Tax=Streptomyces sp. NPDC020422 TaxID=3365074 RepID=UPI0037AD4CD9